MNTTMRTRCGASAVLALVLCIAAPQALAGQGGAPAGRRADDTAAFKEFSARVQAYIKLQKTVESTLPALKATDVPELITAHQAALARMIREARPEAKAGDIFTPAVCEAFRRASGTTLEGPHLAKSLAYMQADSPTPDMHVAVNGIYPGTEANTPISPELLAAYPPLPVEVAYRIVGRTLILLDLKSRMVVDIARLIIPPIS
jgi:hypothetical protein